MADGYVQVPADSVGKKVDTNEFTRYDGATIERQRVELPRPPLEDLDVLNAILIELRLMNRIIAQGLNIQDDPDQLRSDLLLNLT